VGSCSAVIRRLKVSALMWSAVAMSAHLIFRSRACSTTKALRSFRSCSQVNEQLGGGHGLAVVNHLKQLLRVLRCRTHALVSS
jgi:hypothetical protein